MCCLFSYVLKIEQGPCGISKQIAKGGNILVLMFAYLSLALNTQKVSRGRKSFENSPFDIHLDCKGKINCVRIKWIFSKYIKKLAFDTNTFSKSYHLKFSHKR